ncbi:hypothetical protein SVIO_060200 [Streptomyces violaceusniger]|uniref:Integral membrane protein n=1 Tax=Streptomyces violaceusniger TaxID=68280 RepID=A0A4D4L9V3_STRVO|nr:hypothetical protein SVIO_060200 [Streptomyces violaceusniger]
MLIVVSLVTILAAGVLCLELVIRAALLYVGALLGTAVYAGLVDKNMWGHVRRWAGIMIAVILVKPVIITVLALAGALSTNGDKPDAFSAVVSGLSIIILAIFASAMIYRFVPGFGDEIVKARSASADPASRQAAAVISSPAALVKQGINTHSARGGGEAGGGGAAPGRPSPPTPSPAVWRPTPPAPAAEAAGAPPPRPPAAPATPVAPVAAPPQTAAPATTREVTGGDDRRPVAPHRAPSHISDRASPPERDRR